MAMKGYSRLQTVENDVAHTRMRNYVDEAVLLGLSVQPAAARDRQREHTAFDEWLAHSLPRPPVEMAIAKGAGERV
eukprot:128492-Prymnesium_polylepis.1